MYAVDDSYNIWFRYDLSSFMEGAYVTGNMPTEDMTDNISLGLGLLLMFGIHYIEELHNASKMRMIMEIERDHLM